MKKISLLKSLAILGAVTLTSVCVVETALLIHKNIGPENGDLINLNTYDSYTLAETLDHAPRQNEAIDLLVSAGIKNSPTGQIIHPITDKEDIDVTVLTETQQILVSAKNNSTSYVQDSHATISYALPTKQTLASIVGSDTVSAYMDDNYDDDFTKASILKSLQSQYPSLNINHLDVSITKYAQENEGTAVVSVKTGSDLYEGSNAAVTYFTSGSVVMTLNKYLIKPGDTMTPTFKFHNATPSTGLVYTMPVAAQAGTFVWTGSATGTLEYKSGEVPDFIGGPYEIVGTYTISGGNTYVARCIVYAQSNIQSATVTISAPNINAINKNSGTTTFKVNGTTVTTNLAYTISPAVPAGQGLTFSTTTGVLTWDGSTPTNGGMFTITGTNSGTGIKTAIGWNYVFVTPALVATLTVTNPNITNSTRNSGTATMNVNGTNKTVTSWAVTGGLTATANAEGLSFSTSGVITWNGTSMTNGGTYTITATYTATNGISVKALATVYVTPWGVKTGTIVLNSTYCDDKANFIAYQIGRTSYIQGEVHFLDQGWGNNRWLTINDIGSPATGFMTQLIDRDGGGPTLHNGSLSSISATSTSFAPWGGVQNTPTGWYIVSCSWYTNS